MYRWFQFSSKYGGVPNLDIGGMILRHCCQTRLNGPTNDLSKHFVKFLLEDIVLKKKGNSSSSSSSSSTDGTVNMENTENTDEGFRLLLSIVKLALRQQYTSLGQEKKKRKTKTRQKSFLEEFATTLANKLGIEMFDLDPRYYLYIISMILNIPLTHSFFKFVVFLTVQSQGVN